MVVKGANEMQKGFVFLFVMTTVLSVAIGCQPRKSGSTNIELWPILRAKSSSTVEANGSWSKSGNGEAVLGLIDWDNSKSCYGNGKITQREDNLRVWPLFDCHSKEFGANRTASGKILLFSYDSTETK